MGHILFFTIVFVWCAIVAWLEVEIEGKDGWAKNTPTRKFKLDERGKLWYKPFGVQEYQEPVCSERRQKFYAWYIKNMLGGREFTGYHRALDVTQVFVGHLVVYGLFFHATPWQFLWLLEAQVFAFVWLCWALEDTLWFVLNPFYGWRKYKPEFIPWHAKDWWHFAPKGTIMLFLQGCGIYLATCAIMFFVR